VTSNYWIVGPGRVGLAIGSVLAAAGATDGILFVGRQARPPSHPLLASPLTRYTNRLIDTPPANTCVLLAVPDGAIAEVCEHIAGLGSPGAGCTVLHLSGAQSAEVLAPLAAVGYAVGSLHPLQTVAEPEHGVERLRGSFFTFEGDSEARKAASALVATAGGRMLEVHAEDKARYHAACVFAANYVVACAAVATRLLADAANIAEEEAARALQPLWSGAVANLGASGLPGALTGPVARGDVETVKAHLATLDGATRELYAKLALEALEVSRRAGLDGGVAERIEAELRSLGTGGSE